MLARTTSTPRPQRSDAASATHAHFVEEWVNALIVGSVARRHEQPGAFRPGVADDHA